MNSASAPGASDPFRTGAALAPLPDRAHVELAGDDRLSFLHQLTTNHIKALVPGRGCETFLCDSQGKTIGHGYVFALADRLLIDTVAGQSAPLLAHLDRYLIREKVRLADRTADFGELVVAGPRAAEILGRAGVAAVPSAPCEHVEATLGGVAASIRRTDYAGEGSCFVAAAPADLPRVAAALVEAGAEPVAAEALEAARIEQGTPLFGREIGPDNLPQELARDDRAISFVKGCYLGQETVARLDALGHVNRLLVRLRFPDASETPPPGTELVRDGKPVGRITSSIWSASRGLPIALGFVRRPLAKTAVDGWLDWRFTG